MKVSRVGVGVVSCALLLIGSAEPASAYVYTTRTGTTFNNTSGWYRLVNDSSFSAPTNNTAAVSPKINTSCSSAGSFGARLRREQRLQPDITVASTTAGSNCNEPVSSSGTIAAGSAHVDFTLYNTIRTVQVRVCLNGC
jgi:hypothetical protein